MRSITRNMVNCLTSRGQHTKVMHVYRHCGVRWLSNTFAGIPAAPPTAPAQPKHRRRQHETLPGWSVAPWDPAPLPLAAMHNLTLATTTAADRMHWHREYSHMTSMSAGGGAKRDRLRNAKDAI